MGELLREEIELVLFDLVGGVHWVLCETGGGWLYERKLTLYNIRKKKGRKEIKQASG